MKDEHDPQPTAEVPEPLDVMRKAYQDAEFHFEEDEGTLTLRLGLKNLDVTVHCWGRAGDVASIIVRLPIRATEEFRARTGEFLHRLNYAAKRKFWEMDYSDGEIRLVAYTDTITGPLTEGLFRSIFHAVTSTADVTFPYLTSVLSGRMTPEFAADQAEAAIEAFWDKGNNPEEENGKAEGGE
jgi:hypothetical protein